MSSPHDWEQREERQADGWNIEPGCIDLVETDYDHAKSKRYLVCQQQRLQSMLKSFRRQKPYYKP